MEENYLLGYLKADSYNSLGVQFEFGDANSRSAAGNSRGAWGKSPPLMFIILVADSCMHMEVCPPLLVTACFATHVLVDE